MNPILSRLLTGILGAIVGAIFNTGIGFILYQVFKPVKSENMLGEPIYYGFGFPIIGFFLGLLIGLIVGVLQLKYLFSLIIGTLFTFILFSIIVVSAGGGDLDYWEGRKNVLILLVAVLFDGFLVSNIVWLICNEVLKRFVRKQSLE